MAASYSTAFEQVRGPVLESLATVDDSHGDGGQSRNLADPARRAVSPVLPAEITTRLADLILPLPHPVWNCRLNRAAGFQQIDLPLGRFSSPQL